MDAARDAAIIGADRQRHLIRSRILATLAILLLLAGLMVAVCPFMLRAMADAPRLGSVSGGFASMAASYPYTFTRTDARRGARVRPAAIEVGAAGPG